MTTGSEPNSPPDDTSTYSGSTPRRRLATVWPLPQQRAGAPSPSHAVWLEAAVRRVAATYSRRGACALLLAPPPPEPASAANAGSPEEETLAGLAATAEQLTRMNRPTDVRALTYPGPTDSTAPQPVGGSGPRLVISTPLVFPIGSTDYRSRSAGHRLDRSGRSAAVDAADRYSLVITYLDPQAADWVAEVPWGSLLVPHGILAVITQSDRPKRLPDPIGRLLSHVSGRGGIALLDRIAFLAASPEATAGTAVEPVARTGVHTELLVLTRTAAADSRTGVGR